MVFIPQHINRLLDQFTQKRVLIIGDAMLDAYLWGKVTRISPEAPVPVVSVSKREWRIGGAANVAWNIQTLGATPILCSTIGSDDHGDRLLEVMKNEGLTDEGIFRLDNRPTTTKTRIIGGSQQMLRVDAEETAPLEGEQADLFEQHVLKLIEKQGVNLIILQDYDKGVFTPPLIEKIINKANGLRIPVAVDPKKRNFLAYKHVQLFKPNLKEMVEGLNQTATPEKDALDKMVDTLWQKMPCDRVMITLSEKGVYLKNATESMIRPAHLRNIADVSGAGDTVIAVAALAMASGAEDDILLALSNLAGGLVCEQTGVVPLRLDELRNEGLKVLTS